MHLKDIFFEPDDNNKPQQPAPDKKSSNVPGKASSVSQESISEPIGSISDASATSAPSMGAGVDGYVQLLKNAMKSHPGKGPDYYQFISAIEKMKTMAMDDKTKFASVFTGFDVQGITPQFLVDSAKQYQSLFASKKSDFEAALNQSVAQNVEAKKTQIQNLKATNKSIDDHMQSLNEQKIANEDSIKKLSSEITTASTKIESNKADFNTAYEQMNQDIENNIQRITEYLGATNN
jgi:hypothetical protein